MKKIVRLFSQFVDEKTLKQIWKKKSRTMVHEEEMQYVLVAYLNPEQNLEDLSNHVFFVMNQFEYKFENALGNIFFFKSHDKRFKDISISDVKILQYIGNIKHTFLSKRIDSYSFVVEFSFNENLFEKLLEVEYGHCMKMEKETDNEN